MSKKSGSVFNRALLAGHFIGRANKKTRKAERIMAKIKRQEPWRFRKPGGI